MRRILIIALLCAFPLFAQDTKDRRVLGLELDSAAHVYVVKQVRPDGVAILTPMIPVNIGVQAGPAWQKGDVLHCKASTKTSGVIADGQKEHVSAIEFSCAEK